MNEKVKVSEWERERIGEGEGEEEGEVMDLTTVERIHETQSTL